MKNLKEYREKVGLSQKDLAEKVGLKQQRYNHYERGRRELPVSVAKEIGRILEIDWWKLYE